MILTTWILVVIAHSLVVQGTLSSTGARVHHCTTSHNCAHDECCVSISQPRGRRDVVSPALSTTQPGTCHRLGTTASRCIAHAHMHPATTGLYYTCPCRRDHVCNGTGMIEVPQGEIGMCEPNIRIVHPTNPTHHPCSSGADCPGTECCVSNVRPMGRRRRNAHGHCMAMGMSGSGCFARQPSGKPDAVTYKCPCSSGLTCHGQGVYDVPLGEIGQCR